MPDPGVLRLPKREPTTGDVPCNAASVLRAGRSPCAPADGGGRRSGVQQPGHGVGAFLCQPVKSCQRKQTACT
jgi:hypothetical protein